MKLIKIDFDHKLIGTEGIVVKTRYGREVNQLTYFNGANDWPLVGVIDGELYAWTLNGFESLGEDRGDADLIMYRTVKVMTVDEWKDSAYPLYTIMSEGERETFIQNRAGADALAAAIKRGEVDISDD
jgi:hypothetical protein